MIIIKKKPIVGAYANLILNGGFSSALDNWFNRNNATVSWYNGGGLAQADGVSTPSTPSRLLTQYIPVGAGGNYDYSIIKDVLASADASLLLSVTLKQVGGSASQQIVNQPCGSLGDLTHSGSFTANADFHKIEIEVNLVAP